MSSPESPNYEPLLEQVDENLSEEPSDSMEPLLTAEERSNTYALYYATTSSRDALQRDLGQDEDLSEIEISTYEFKVNELEEYLTRITAINNLEKVNGEYPANLEVVEQDITINIHDLELNIDEFNNILADAREQLQLRLNTEQALESDAEEIADGIQEGEIDTPEQAAQALAQTAAAEQVSRDTEQEATGGIQSMIEEFMNMFKEFFDSITGPSGLGGLFSFFRNDAEEESESEEEPELREGTQLRLENSWLSGRSYEAYPALNPFPMPIETRTVQFEGREPSGIVDTPYGYLMVDDGGEVVILSEDYTIQGTLDIGGDLEGITYNPETNKVYVVEEREQLLRELDYTNGNLSETGMQWDLSSLIPYHNDNMGLEALTYANGKFYVGDQHDGRIHVIEAREDGSAIEISVIDPPTGINTDSTALYYEEDSGLIYAVWDDDNRMALIDSNTNEYVCQFDVSSSSGNDVDLDEGLFVDGNNNLHLAHDAGRVQHVR